MKYILWIVAILILSVSASNAGQKVSFEPAGPPPEGYALVYFYRLDVPPSLVKSKLLIDGKQITKMPNYGYSWFYLKEGMHNLQSKWGALSGVPSVESAFEVEEGKTYYLRLVGQLDYKDLSAIMSSGVAKMKEEIAVKELEVVKKYAAASVEKIN